MTKSQSLVERLRYEIALVNDAALLRECLAEIERLKRELKNLAPVGRYNGHGIEYWYSQADRLRAALERINSERAAKGPNGPMPYNAIIKMWHIARTALDGSPSSAQQEEAK